MELSGGGVLVIPISRGFADDGRCCLARRMAPCLWCMACRMSTQVVVRGQELKIVEAQTRNPANMSEGSRVAAESDGDRSPGRWADCWNWSACKPVWLKVDTFHASEHGAFPLERRDRDVLTGNADFGDRGTRLEWERPSVDKR